MTHRILVADRAATDLEEAFHWLRERSPESAVLWYNGFIDTLKSLEKNPERCALAPESHKMKIEIRQILYGRGRSYRALFCVRGKDVVVLHIRHTARREAEAEDLF